MTQDPLSLIKNYAKAYESLLLIHETSDSLTFFYDNKRKTLTRESIKETQKENTLLANVITKALQGAFL